MITLLGIFQKIGLLVIAVTVIYGLYSFIRIRLKIGFIALVVAFVTMLFTGCCEQVKLFIMTPTEKAQYIAEKKADNDRREAREQARKNKEEAEKKAEEEKKAAEKAQEEAQKQAEKKAKEEKEAAAKAEREAAAAAEKQRKENTISLGDTPSKIKRLKGEPNSEKKQTTNEGTFIWYIYYKNGIDHSSGTITYQFHNSSLASITEY